jgi:phosphoinositide-3-kinase regulatory subunit 4
MLNKTVLISIDDNSAPLILKIFFKNNYDENDKILFNFEYEKMKGIRRQILNKQINNICPILNMENNPQEGMIYRQYVEYDLKERIYLMPYLQHIEKIWITFQILYALNDLKQMNIIHGDLKPENILLSSNLSVYITDFASYKPAYISIDDITNYTYYFGTNNTNSMKGCYLAPERLMEKNNNNINNITENIDKTFAMDIFSAGVIIA